MQKAGLASATGRADKKFTIRSGAMGARSLRKHAQKQTGRNVRPVVSALSPLFQFKPFGFKCGKFDLAFS